MFFFAILRKSHAQMSGNRYGKFTHASQMPQKLKFSKLVNKIHSNILDTSSVHRFLCVIKFKLKNFYNKYEMVHHKIQYDALAQWHKYFNHYNFLHIYIVLSRILFELKLKRMVIFNLKYFPSVLCEYLSNLEYTE